MKKYVVQLSYRVRPGLPGPVQPQILKPVWGPGHRFSIANDNLLTVIVQVRADSEGEAVANADAKVRRLWPTVAFGSLRPINSWAGRERVLVGAPLLRRQVATRGPIPKGPRWGADGGPWLDDGPDDGPDDAGGTAGVRETRRPPPGPGHLYAEADLPC